MPKIEARTDKLQQAHERLTEAVESIVTGDDWARMLKTAAKFHRYSFNNQLLIFCQRPDATQVAGFLRWKSLGRSVRKGEKGIQILAPCRYKTKIEDGSGEEQTLYQLRGFRIVHVFDISQTDGEDLDLNLVRPKLLNGEAPEGLWDALVTQATDAGFDVVRTQRGSANGYCDFLGKEIGVRPELSDLQALKTLIHELSHALLHSEGATSREIAEVEVESAAYIVLDALSLSSDSYSFPYVARWSNGDVELVKASAERSISCARAILEGLDEGVTETTARLEHGS